MLDWSYIVKIKFNGTTIFEKNSLENKKHLEELKNISCNKTSFPKEILNLEVFNNAR